MGSTLSKVKWDDCRINLRNSFIREETAKTIVKNISHRCTSLKLDTNFLGEPGCKSIGSLLNTNDVLTELTLSSNAIGPAGVQHLVDGIMGNKKCKLTVLDLSYNRLTDAGAHALVPMLRSETFIIKLYVNGNEFTGDGASAMFNALCDRSNEHDITSHVAPAGSVVSTNSDNTSPHLSNGNTPTALRELECGFNPAIGDAAMESVAHMLLEHQSLIALSLNQNNFTGAGIEKVVDTITESLSSLNPKLKLNLANNHLGDNGATAVVHVLGCMRACVSRRRNRLCCLYNNLGRLQASLYEKNPKADYFVDLSHNGIGHPGYTALMKATSAHPRSEYLLELSGNTLTKMKTKESEENDGDLALEFNTIGVIAQHPSGYGDVCLF